MTLIQILLRVAETKGYFVVGHPLPSAQQASIYLFQLYGPLNPSFTQMLLFCHKKLINGHP